MESKAAITNQRAEAPKGLMDAKSVAFLFAPSILFIGMALLALFYAASYTDMAQGKTAAAYNEKFKRERDEMAAKIAAGDQQPTRQHLLARLDKSADVELAWQSGVTACAWSMRRIGMGVLLGVLAQLYVILRLRAHYKKLAVDATAPCSQQQTRGEPHSE